MQKLNVRFKSETEQLLSDLAEKRNSTVSKVARDAMEFGIGIMSSSGDHIKREDFFKSIEERLSEANA